MVRLRCYPLGFPNGTAGVDGEANRSDRIGAKFGEVAEWSKAAVLKTVDG
jgi:hypothetical protein